MADELEFHLKRPFTAGGKEIKQLTLRAPTTEDVIAVGMPLEPTANGRLSFNLAMMRDYVVRLGNVPPSTILKMDHRDFMKLVMAMATHFFGDSAAEG